VAGARLPIDTDEATFTPVLETPTKALVLPRLVVGPNSNQYVVAERFEVTSPFRLTVVLVTPLAASVWTAGMLPAGGGLPCVVWNEYCVPANLPY
jgi:hypothetical protein